jgi:hypothetical protein
MKLGIMQPYFFPYIGYWQLIHVVDRFVIYDDVNFIKGGWINRNRILINGAPAYLTVPLHQQSPFKHIFETGLESSSVWRNKLIKMVEITYRKANHFAVVFPVVEKIIRFKTDNLSDYLVNQLRVLSFFMNIDTEFVQTSRCYKNNDLTGQERILDICEREKAATYINPKGGQTLYDGKVFRRADIDLRFIVMRTLPYKQRTCGFIPCLSIIDALMEIGPDEMKPQLDAFDLIVPD